MNAGIKVWLDDNRPAPEGWVWAATAEQAQVKLLLGNVEELSLDYDLDKPVCERCNFRCGFKDPGECKNLCACHRQGDVNGLDFVRWMVARRVWPKHKPVVHSTAGHHAEEMKRLIDANFPG